MPGDGYVVINLTEFMAEAESPLTDISDLDDLDTADGHLMILANVIDTECL